MVIHKANIKLREQSELPKKLYVGYSADTPGGV